MGVSLVGSSAFLFSQEPRVSSSSREKWVRADESVGTGVESVGNVRAARLHLSPEIKDASVAVGGNGSVGAEAVAEAVASVVADVVAEAVAKAVDEIKEEAKAEAMAMAEAEARAKAIAEARADAKAEVKAEAEWKAKVEAEWKAKAEAKEGEFAEAFAEAKAKAIEEAKAEAKAEVKAEAKAKAKAEANAKAGSEILAKAIKEAKAEAKAGNGGHEPDEGDIGWVSGEFGFSGDWRKALLIPGEGERAGNLTMRGDRCMSEGNQKQMGQIFERNKKTPPSEKVGGHFVWYCSKPPKICDFTSFSCNRYFGVYY